MTYKEAHDLIETLHYKGNKLSKEAFDNLHAMLSMIPANTKDVADLYDALATLIPYEKQPQAVKDLLETLPQEVTIGFECG